MGMAVDANVLIFERIREERRGGRSLIQAVDAGFRHALSTIVDANVTTLIAALILFYLGSGPVKGFAVTLAVGIATSMFSALVFTRSIYELWLGKRQPEGLSI
jgi:protein-export membrane protein SecD